MPPKPKGASPTPRGRGPATSLGGDSVEGKTEAVGVYGRFRPAAKGMREGPIEMLSAHKVQVREYEFTLDGVFEQITTQQQVARLPILTSQPSHNPATLSNSTTRPWQVYDTSARQNVATVVDGLNATLMAYGQTGSGKTHAMFGPDEVVSNFSESEPVMHGMIPRSIKQIFEALEALAPEDESKYSVQCSFLELCEWPPSEPL